jgi:hypothetical protein
MSAERAATAFIAARLPLLDYGISWIESNLFGPQNAAPGRPMIEQRAAA